MASSKRTKSKPGKVAASRAKPAPAPVMLVSEHEAILEVRRKEYDQRVGIAREMMLGDARSAVRQSLATASQAAKDRADEALFGKKHRMVSESLNDTAKTIDLKLANLLKHDD